MSIKKHSDNALWFGFLQEFNAILCTIYTCMYYCYKCLLDLPMQRFIGPFHVLLMPFLKIMIYLLCSRIQCNLSFYVHFKNRKIKWNKATCLRKKMQNKNIIDLFLVIHTSIVLHLLIWNLIGSGHRWNSPLSFMYSWTSFTRDAYCLF